MNFSGAKVDICRKTSSKSKQNKEKKICQIEEVKKKLIMLGPEIDVGALAQLSSENLKLLLRKIPGNKDLIIEPHLIPPLDKIGGMSMIKSCNVDRVFKLEQRWPDASASSTKVYFVTPTLNQAKIIIEHMQMSNNIQKGLHFHVIFTPKLLKEIDILFEEEGIHGKIVVHDYMWELIPLDYDLLSLEMGPQFFLTSFCQEEHSLLPSVAQSLLGIQTLFGGIKNKIGVGKHSVAILEQMKLLENRQQLASSGSSREISTLMVVDRSVDYASVLLSPLTYEALLNEVFKNVCGTIDLDERVTKGDHVKLQLSSKDKMFAKIRTQHFTNIFASLSSHAKQLKQQQAKAANMSINEMKSFVQKELKDMQNQSRAVALHIGACEVIQKEKGSDYEYTLPLEHGLVAGTVYKETLVYLEEAMAQMKPMTTILRLLCLLSLFNNGISSGDFERVKHQFLQTYGFDKIVLMQKLKNMGLLTSREALVALKASMPGSNKDPAPSFFQVAKKLGLNTTSGAGDLGNPVVASSQMQEDVSYVFNGAYTPLTCKLVKDALASKAKLEESLKDMKVKHKIEMSAAASPGKVVVVYYVGGYTFSEVAAFRHLQTILGYQFIVAGTSKLSGQDLLNYELISK